MKFTRWLRLGKQWAAAWAMSATAFTAATASAQSLPAVTIQLDGSWPEQLAVEVREDLGASLGERGVRVLADGDPRARATLRISPPSDGVPQVQVEVVTRDAAIAAARELSLGREHPDTWSVAIAATADELLAATWSLPDVAPVPAIVPREAEQPVTRYAPRPAFAPKPRHGELGLGFALEQYLPDAQLYGADVFGALRITPRLQGELGFWFRDIVSQASASGDVYGTVLGADIVLSGNLMRTHWFGLDVLGGVHGGVVWLEGRADTGAETNSVTGAVFSARVGGRASLFTTERTRLGVSATAGLPLVTASASDSGREVVRLRGAELSARLEVGWLF